MPKRKVQLTPEQERRNAQILAGLEAERERLRIETRQIQLTWQQHQEEKRASRRSAS